MEAAVRKSPLVKEALVFGVNRSTLGVAVIPSKSEVSAPDISAIVLEANKIAPAHAQISPELVLLLPEDASLPKASKGTVQRGKAYEAYAAAIDGTYKRYESSDQSNGIPKKLQLAPTELLDYILDRIRETMQVKEVHADDDLFNLGLNSTQALRVRNLLKAVSTVTRWSVPSRLTRYICHTEARPRPEGHIAAKYRV